MIKVTARPGEQAQQLYRRLKKLCEKEGLVREMRRNSYYEKPSERKRRQERKTLRRIAKLQREAESPKRR